QATTASSQNGFPQENEEKIEIAATMVRTTARIGGVAERPRPRSASPGETSSPSAGRSSQPSTYRVRPKPAKIVNTTNTTRINTGSTPKVRPMPPATPAILRSVPDRRGRLDHQSPPAAPGPAGRSF